MGLGPRILSDICCLWYSGPSYPSSPVEVVVVAAAAAVVVVCDICDDEGALCIVSTNKINMLEGKVVAHLSPIVYLSKQLIQLGGFFVLSEQKT